MALRGLEGRNPRASDGEGAAGRCTRDKSSFMGTGQGQHPADSLESETGWRGLPAACKNLSKSLVEKKMPSHTSNNFFSF